MNKHLFLQGDARHIPLPDKSVHAVITSPPYYDLRHYTASEQEIGRSERGGLKGYVLDLGDAFEEVRRVLRDDGTLSLNLGDTYACKQLLGIPWQVASHLRHRGWILRADCIWDKPNALPDTSRDRPEHYHEYVFLFSKTMKNYWDKQAVAKGERRTVRRVPTRGIKGAHFAAFPPALVVPHILQGTSEAGVCPICLAPWTRQVKRTRIPTRPGKTCKVDASGKANRDPRRHITLVETIGWEPSCSCPPAPPIPATVLDPFAGAFTTSLACEWTGRSSVGIDLSGEYITLGRDRLAKEGPPKVKGQRPLRRPDLPGQKSFAFNLPNLNSCP